MAKDGPCNELCFTQVLAHQNGHLAHVVNSRKRKHEPVSGHLYLWPFGFDEGILNGVLADARRANLRDGITGALICRGDIYIQWLEGPEEQVRNTLERIKRDNRHLEVKLHVAEPVSERMFAKWAMLHDPAASWIWSQHEVANGAVERATPKEVVGFFARLHDVSSAPDRG